jgi:subtilisin-like proprotein convertase family protein
MKIRLSGVHRAATTAWVLAAVLTVGVPVGRAVSGDGTNLKIPLASRSKWDVLKEMFKSGARPGPQLPKALMAPCRGGWPRPSGVSYSQFAEVEIAISDTVSLRRLHSYPLAPGSRIETLDDGARVRAQLPALIVADLIEQGADVKVLRDFLLWEKSATQPDMTKARLSAAATCSGTSLSGTHGTNYAIPEGDWTYSDIDISGAPSNAQVTCVDVHYEIIHPKAGDVVVDLTDEDITYEYHLHTSSASDNSVNINQTVTGITLFSGQDSGYQYGAEGVNQKWTLWALDQYPGHTGYIDTWWIKVYYSVPSTSPSNDACANAVVLTDNTPYPGTTVGATGAYQSRCAFHDLLDTWHVFTPTQTGLVTITAAGGAGQGVVTFDPTLAVFDGCGGPELACNDDDCASVNSARITMQMSHTTTYYIRVAGYDYRTGSYTLTVQQHAKETPAAPSVPSPADGATSVETQLVLSWNNSAGLVDTLNIAKKLSKPATEEVDSPKVIYGKDDRIEEYQVTNSAYRHAGDATVMLVYWEDLTPNGNGTYTLPSKTFAQWYLDLDPIATGLPLCDDERFRDEPAPGVCSGVLVAPDVIATAGHCVACETIGDLAAVFGFVMTEASTARLTVSADDVYRCSQVIAYHDSYPDWSLVRLDRIVTSHVPVNMRVSGQIADAELLLAIGHPWGLPRKYDAGGIVRDNSAASYFQANVDTYAGSSGSPIFNRSTLEIEGVVSTGKPDFITDPGGTCDRSAVCADTGCPDWENITRATAFSGVLPSFDVYLGTSASSMALVEAYSPVPWFNPGILNTGTTYYWKVVARNAWTEAASPIWSFQTVSVTAIKPVYRFWSAKTGGHFYTIKEAEKNKILATYSNYVWAFEGPVFYAFEAAQPGTAPVYRFWSDKSASHFYTMSENEKNKLVTKYANVWKYEGPQFYAYPTTAAPPAGTRPVYRFYAPKTGAHFYTIKESERDKVKNVLSATWTDEGEAWYAFE